MREAEMDIFKSAWFTRFAKKKRFLLLCFSMQSSEPNVV
jgi:hypothetical protein